MTHKEFYIWLEGYLYGKLENKHIDISVIVERMPIPVNPIPKDDDLGYPPKIVM